MAKKRKQELEAGKISQPQKKQHQSLKEKQKKEEEIKIQKAVQEDEEEEVEDGPEEDNDDEEDEEDDGEEDNDEEEEDEEDGEEDGEEEENPANQVSFSSAAVGKLINDEEDDPIEKLLEPFGKERLINLLKEAADRHPDVAKSIRSIADQDPMHRKIFVHGLGWDATTGTLINAFKIYGEIEDCKAVIDKVSGKCKGYGFVLFKKRSGASKALEQPHKKIGNRMTACQLASIGPVPSSGMVAPAPSTQQVVEYPQRKIYVSNVGVELDPQRLTAFFAKFGEIEEGPLGLDKVTGKPRGFCLFVYKTVESAKKALEEPHKNFEGHILHCQIAVDGLKAGKKPPHVHPNVQNSQFQQHNVGGTAAGAGHLMAPSARPSVGFNQGAAAASALNPAIGQALTTLLATQGAGLDLTNLLGTLGSVAPVNQGGVPAAGPVIPPTYGNQANMSQGMIGTYGNQWSGYPNQVGQGVNGRGQYTSGQYGDTAPYMSH